MLLLIIQKYSLLERWFPSKQLTDKSFLNIPAILRISKNTFSKVQKQNAILVSTFIRYTFTCELLFTYKLSISKKNRKLLLDIPVRLNIIFLHEDLSKLIWCPKLLEYIHKRFQGDRTGVKVLMIHHM